MYTKPFDGTHQISDWETVMKLTQKQTDMVSFYAFHGARREAKDSLIFLKNSEKTNEYKEGWIARLELLAVMEQTS